MKADFSLIINKAIHITFKNKWLWIFALLLGGSGASLPNGSDLPSSRSDRPTREERPKFQDRQNTPLNTNKPLDILSAIPQVLGESTVSLEGALSKVPVYYWVVILLLVVLSVTFTSVLLMYVHGWAQSALVFGVNQEALDVTATLSSASKAGRQFSWEMVKLNLIPGIVFFIVSGALFIVLGLLTVIQPTLGVVALLIASIPWLVAFIIFSASLHLAKYPLILEHLSWSASFRKALTVFKAYFLDIVAMGLINCVMQVVVGFASCVIVGVLALVGLAGAAALTIMPALLVVGIIIGILLFLVFISAMSVVSAAFQVFQEATWVLLYRQLMSMDTKPVVMQEGEVPHAG